MNRKKFLVLFILFFLTMTFIPLLPPVSAGPYDAWEDFKPIKVTLGNNTYAMWINISYNASMQADFDDVRFIDKDNTTALDYWIERVVDNSYAWFWVESPADIETDNCFLMVYGNDAVGNESDGDDTFYWFTNFSSNVTGTFSNQGNPDYYQLTVDTSVTDCYDGYRLYYRYNMTDEWDSATDTQFVGVTSHDTFTPATEQCDNGTYHTFSTDTDNGALDDLSCHYTAGRNHTAYVDGSYGVTSDVAETLNFICDTKINETMNINFTILNDSRAKIEGARTTTDGGKDFTNANNITFFMKTPDPVVRMIKHNAGYGKLKLKIDDTDPQTCAIFIDYMFLSAYDYPEPTGAEGGYKDYSPPAGDYECSPTSHESGSWEFSEKVLDGTLDEAWYEDHYPSWYVYDRSAEWGGNYSYSFFDNGAAGGGINVTFLNNSGMNRTQVVMNVHINDTNPFNSDVSLGPVYQDCSGNRLFFLVGGGGTSSAYVLWYNATTETYWDLGTRGEINVTDVNASNLTNWRTGIGNTHIGDDEYDWTVNMSGPDGVWIKVLTNPFCECYKFKYWGSDTFRGLMNEPVDWVLEYCEEDLPRWNLTHCNLTCVGLATWNPETEKDIRSDFDIISVYQENYSLNSSSANGFYPSGKPFMEFPTFNSSIILNNASAFIEDWFAGNISQEYVIPYLINITNSTNKESRPYEPEAWFDWGTNQNDTVRYHSAFLTNATNLSESLYYNNYLWLYIHMTPYGIGIQDEWCAVLIDMPPVGSWDSNDRVFYTDVTGNDLQWNGNASVPIVNANLSAWYTARTSYQNIYRYMNHTQFQFLIPQAELIDGDGNAINQTHVFNLSIITGAVWDENACVWNNYNETACLPYTANENETNLKGFFYGGTYFESETDLTIYDDNLTNWGQGQIIGDAEFGEEFSNVIWVNKTDNVTRIGPGNLSTNINISIVVTNNGTGPLHQVFINTTFLKCLCSSEWDWNITDASNRSAIIWGHNDSCYTLIHGDEFDTILPGAHETFWFHVHVNQCDGENLSGVMWNNATVNCTEGVTDTDSNWVRMGGEVTRIRICYNPDVGMIDTDRTIFTVIGIILLIASIMLIMGIIKKTGIM